MPPIPTKEGLMILIDCAASMQPHMDEVLRAVSAIVKERILQGGSNEVGLLCFDVPDEKTNNPLHSKAAEDGDYSQYVGVAELHQVSKVTINTLMKLPQVPELGSGDRGDLLDAMIVGIHLLKNRTFKKQYRRRIILITDAAREVSGIQEALEPTISEYMELNCVLDVVGVDFSTDAAQREDMDDDTPASVKSQNEDLLRSVAQTTGGTVRSPSEIINSLEFATKVVNPRAAKINLRLGSVLNIPVKTFAKVSQKSMETLKKEQREGGAPLKQQRSYRLPEEPDAPVEFDEYCKAYKYGAEVVTIEESTSHLTKLEPEEAAITIIGSVEKSAVPPFLYSCGTNIVFAEAGTKAALKVSAIVQGLKRENAALIVRWVKTPKSGPLLGCLTPDTAFTEGDRLLLHQLPFADCMRHRPLPSLNSSRRAPNAAQQAAADQIVAAMTFPSDTRQGGEVDDLTLNPVMVLATQTKVIRSMNPDAPIPPLPPFLAAALEPDPTMMNSKATRSALDAFGENFTLTKEEGKEKKKKTYWSDAINDQQFYMGNGLENGDKNTDMDGTDAKTEVKKDTKKTVGTSTPADDFEEILKNSDGDETIIQSAVQQLQDIISQLVGLGLGEGGLRKAVSCLCALRKLAVTKQTGTNYNEFLQSLAKKLGGRHPLWATCATSKAIEPCTPVSSAEDPKSDMSLADAATYFENLSAGGSGTGAAVKPEPLSQMDDLDDLA